MTGTLQGKIEDLNNNVYRGRIEADNLTPLGQREIRNALFAIIEQGSDAARVRALKDLDLQFARHPELATEAKIARITEMAAADTATPAFKQVAAQVLETTRNPQPVEARIAPTISEYDFRFG